MTCSTSSSILSKDVEAAAASGLLQREPFIVSGVPADRPFRTWDIVPTRARSDWGHRVLSLVFHAHSYNGNVTRPLSISCIAAAIVCVSMQASAIGPCPAPVIASQPVPVIACRMGSASFGVSATSDTAVTYQWQRQVTAGVFENLSDSTIALGNGTMTLVGTQTARLRLLTQVPVGSPSATFRCVVTNACGSTNSETASLALITLCCPADLDNDGSFANGNTRDNAVTINDLLYFLDGFEQGNPTLDMDNGTYTGTRDGAVDVSDLLYFLARFEEGC